MKSTRGKASSPAAAANLQLRMELKWIEPVIWRRLVIPANITLGRLHRVIQAVMGWTDSHLHEFMIAGEHYGFADADEELLPYRVIPETRVRLDAALQRNKTFDYLYDFGDSWEHQLRVENTLPGAPLRHPICIGGECASPPEDVGGPPGYADFLRIILDAKDPEHEETLQWCGGAFDPTFFDIDLVNRLLKRFKL